MANWNLDQVGQWLVANGFRKYAHTFRNEDIDGLALLELREKEIFQLLILIDSNGIRRNPSTRLQQCFRLKLEQLKNSPERQQITNLVIESGERSKILLIKSNDPKLKFFQSHFISTFLSKDFSKKFHVQLKIPSIIHPEMKKEFFIEIVGTIENIRKASEQIQSLFSTVKHHVFNDEKIIKYSKRISSDSALSVLEKIFFEKKKLTVWEKSNVLSGFFRVFYLHGDGEFQSSIEFLRQTLTNEIMMIKDLTISNLSQMSKKCQEEFNEFLRMKSNQSTMTIISVQYPFQSEISLIFFGLKSSVRIAKKQLTILIDKHQLKTVRLDLNLTQLKFLLDNCREKLKQLEIDHQLSNVKISIGENSFVAPKFLIRSIRESIFSMIFHSATLIYQFLPNALELTEKIRTQLKNFIESFHCELKEIRLKTKDQSFLLPRKPLGKNCSSKFLQRESNRFLSSLSKRKTISIGSNSIEIQRSSDETFDLEVISTVADAQKEQIDSTEKNLYLETDGGRRILFIHWSPPSTFNDQSNLSIEKFFSLSLNQIVQNCSTTVKTIRYVTTGWERSPCRGELLLQLMKLLEKETFVDRSWRIFFICDENQTNLFDDLLQISPNSDNDEFLYPISTLTITWKGTEMKGVKRCEKKLKEFIDENLLRIARVDRAFDGHQWNQLMINAFYQFCLDQLVYPRWTTHFELIGKVKAVEKAKEKYRWMFRTNQLRLSSIPKKLKKSNRFNFLLTCSSHDEQNSIQLANRLIDENYLVTIDFSDRKNLSIFSTLDRIDVILICFTWNYFTNANCRIALESIKSSTKKFLPIVFPPTHGENLWNETIQLEEAFYQIFQREIQFRFNENFDQLLCESLRYTKPGAVGQIYPVEDLVVEEENFHVEIVEERQTTLQINREEKQRIYDLYLEKTLETENIPEDELNELIVSLQFILHDHSNEKSDEENDDQFELIRTENIHLQSFLEQMQRWIDKASSTSTIKGNLQPFTLTGDFNDAIFSVSSGEKLPWWETQKLIENDQSPPKPPDELIQIGSFFNADESHQYFERFIDRDLQDEIKQKQKKKVLPKTRQLNHYIKQGTVAWDFQYDREWIKEYHRRLNEILPPKNPVNPSDLWHRLLVKNGQLMSDLKAGKISLQSDRFQGRIGVEIKDREEQRKLEQIDQPSNKRWKRIFRLLPNDGSKEHFIKFIQQKNKTFSTQ